MSDEQIEANRTNAQESTGPRTAEGKASSRMNAAKHGIFAREVVLRGQHRGEREREFQELHRVYREHLAPVGPVEEMLVERMVTTYWRLRRVLIAERGEIIGSLEEAERRSRMRNPGWFLEPPAVELTIPWTHGEWQVLDEARDCVRIDGELTDEVMERIAKALVKRARTAEELREAREVVPADAEGMSAEALKAARQQRVLKLLDGLVESCEWGLRNIAKREESKMQVRRDASLLPEQRVLDKLLRYESGLERQFYRAMNQLERLQRMRKGEVVPPPLAVQVS